MNKECQLPFDSAVRNTYMKAFLICWFQKTLNTIFLCSLGPRCWFVVALFVVVVFIVGLIKISLFEMSNTPIQELGHKEDDLNAADDGEP